MDTNGVPTRPKLEMLPRLVMYLRLGSPITTVLAPLHEISTNNAGTSRDALSSVFGACCWPIEGGSEKEGEQWEI